MTVTETVLPDFSIGSASPMLLHTEGGLLKFGITFSGHVCSPEGYYARQRNTRREALAEAHRRKRLKKDVEQTQKKLRQAEKEHRDYERRCAEMHKAIVFTPKDLGDGHIWGGTTLHKKKRLLALNRLRHESELTPHQLGRWEVFATTWDTRMAEEHKADWGKLFVEILQDLWTVSYTHLTLPTKRIV